MASAGAFIRLYIAVFTIVLAIMAPSCVFALGDSQFKTLVLSPINSTILASDLAKKKLAGSFGSFDFTYDPKLVEEGRSVMATYRDLRLHAKAMRTAAYQERLQNEVVIPISTEDKEDLKTLRTFAKRDLEVFLSRKTRYLERLAAVLCGLHLRTDFTNRVLALVNDQFFKHSDVVARANTNSTAVHLNIGVGASVPEWFLASLRKLPLLSGLPEKAGFYMGFSVGLAVVHEMVDGSPYVRIEPLAEFRRSERIIGALLSVNTSISVSTELSIPKSVATSGQHASFISFAGTALTSAPSSLRVSRNVIGIGLPPFGGLLTVIQGKNHSFRADDTGIPKLINYVNDYFSEFLMPPPRPRGLSCSALFGGL